MNFLILESKQTLHLIFIHWKNLALASIEKKNQISFNFFAAKIQKIFTFLGHLLLSIFLLLKMMRAMAGKALELIECEIPFL